MAHTKLTDSMPASYCIRVQGNLSKNWSTRLGGMRITTTMKNSGIPVTTLSGQLPDQAALCGLLNTLHDLRLPILFVECAGWHESNQRINSLF